MESEGLIGTTTVVGWGILDPLGGPSGGAVGEVIIATEIPVNAGRKWRGGS